MSHRTGRNPVAISLCLMLACVAVAVFCTASAHASYYKMLLCAGNNGPGAYQTATNTTSASNPGGIFSFTNYCGPAPDPAGSNAFLRIAENKDAGTAGVTAYGSISWTTTPWVAIVAGGGYTREPNAFNDGWRARFWLEGWDGSVNNALMQGTGVANGSLGGIGWWTTSTFAPHLWPFGGYGSYRRFVFEMTCYRPSGCDRSHFNAVDANTLKLTLQDAQDPSVSLVGSAIVNGAWVRGTQAIGWGESDQGSGLRFTRLKLDGAIPGGGLIDWRGSCDLGATGPSGEFARRFNPCPTGGPYWRSYPLNTASLSDGAHSLAVCAQDYGQSQSGGESCAARTIRTDNTAPGKPAGLQVTSSNPARYLDRFGARFSLPFNAGSPIRKVHYYVTDAAGKVVVPEKTIAATNPTSLSGLEGPAKPGAYTLHVALEDEVGWVGAASSAPIPHDTIPPAAPQGLHVIGTTTHRVPKFDVRWSNVTDNGSPITVAHYEVIDSAGHVVDAGPDRLGGQHRGDQGDRDAADAGDYRARVWLADEEGNVGAASTVALPRDTIPPAAPQSLHVVGTTAHRVPRFDVRWSDVPDNGSPITVAHYEVIDSAGHAVTPTQTASGEGIEAIKGIATPAAAGDYRVRVWLADEEGNVGAASTVAVPRDTTPPAAPQQVSVAAPAQSRAERGLDVRWRNLADDGSPIAAAHYRVLDGGGKQVVPPTTVSGSNVESIADLDTPRDRGAYTLVLWLSDAEGNVGAPVRVPLSYECVRSDKGGGSTLTAGLGKRGRPALTVRQGEGAVLRGRLLAAPAAWPARRSACSAGS